MRIAYITHYAELYGANRSLLDLLLELRERGAVEPHVLIPREGAITERLAREQVPFAVVPWKPWMSERVYMGGPHHRVGQYLGYRKAARERAAATRAVAPSVRTQLDRWNIDLVHANSAAVAVVPQLLKDPRRPLVWHIRELPERQYLLHIDAGARAYGAALREADQLIAISEAVRADVLRYTHRTVPVEVIYNGVLSLNDYRSLAERSHERWNDPVPFTFLLAGLLHASKGQEEAIRALDLVRNERPKVKLLIAGGGKADHLHALVRELHLEAHVELPGFVTDMTPLFLRSHALLMCSRNEAMGRVTVEAMGSGLPVIGHASGGTLELVEEGRTGSLYPGGTAELAERMLRLVRDPERARTLGTQAMQRAAERFNIERYASEVNEVYRSVLSRAS